ncbi:2154_t:CDS:2 [Diversispora eburnea]|uniref:2154_t:CDS:1 n=1 Tax=Diversispora eburnea TaxID=1213867 RepID=A0A9N9B4Z9_9GLOM|nr:2154_t:CDS:2 [Diversispora eburnea]
MVQNVAAKNPNELDEITILSTLKIYKDKLPDEAIVSIREQLPEVWTTKKVRKWWNYHKNK